MAKPKLPSFANFYERAIHKRNFLGETTTREIHDLLLTEKSVPAAAATFLATHFLPLPAFYQTTILPAPRAPHGDAQKSVEKLR